MTLGNIDNQIIMTIDDDPVILNLIVGMLKKDYRLRPFVSARTAFAYLSLPEGPGADLILLDYHMPDLDGPEVLRRLKAEPVSAGIPVIFLTGRSDDGAEEDRRLMDLGAAGVLGKPPSAEALRSKIRRLLSGSA